MSRQFCKAKSALLFNYVGLESALLHKSAEQSKFAAQNYEVTQTLPAKLLNNADFALKNHGHMTNFNNKR